MMLPIKSYVIKDKVSGACEVAFVASNLSAWLRDQAAKGNIDPDTTLRIADVIDVDAMEVLLVFEDNKEASKTP